MAWNPRPEVRAVRDAAKKIEQHLGVVVDRSVLLFTTDDSRIGYASYGSNAERCGVAKRLGDAVYEAAMGQAESLDLQHHRYGALDLLTPDGPDFQAIATEVGDRLSMLAAAYAKLPDNDAKAAMIRDLIVPACEMLARFCAHVTITDEHGNDATLKAQAKSKEKTSSDYGA